MWSLCLVLVDTHNYKDMIGMITLMLVTRCRLAMLGERIWAAADVTFERQLTCAH